MINYFVTDPSGVVIKTGSCQAGLLELNAVGGKAHVGICPPGRQMYSDGRFTAIETIKTYRDHRQMEYPPITDQLDALWHGMDEQPDKRIEPFYSTIKAVKDQHPKPQDI